MPVRITIVDNLDHSDYRNKKTPSFISVRGAKSVVKNLEYIETLPVEINLSKSKNLLSVYNLHNVSLDRSY